MRILLFTGKGGVGKTSLAAATGLRLAQMGKHTLVMSVDPAHSVADAFALDVDLFSKRTADPYPINEGLDVQEVNIQAELKRHWREIASYVASVLRTTGVADIEAEELAILPGMEELSAMMYVNQYVRDRRYDVIVLDCAPTAESLRFVSMPSRGSTASSTSGNALSSGFWSRARSISLRSRFAACRSCHAKCSGKSD